MKTKIRFSISVQFFTNFTTKKKKQKWVGLQISEIRVEFLTGAILTGAMIYILFLFCINLSHNYHFVIKTNLSLCSLVLFFDRRNTSNLVTFHNIFFERKPKKFDNRAMGRVNVNDKKGPINFCFIKVLIRKFCVCFSRFGRFW